MSNKIATLKFLDNFYKVSNGKGCETLGITTDKELIDEMMLQDLIFKTDKGYFISTAGQEYLLNNQ